MSNEDAGKKQPMTDTQTQAETRPFPQLHRPAVYHGIHRIFSCPTYGRQKVQNGRVELLAPYEVQRALCSQTHCCWERLNSIDASGGARRSSLASHEQARAGIPKQPKKERVPCGFALGTENSETFLKTLTPKERFSSPGGERLPWVEKVTVLRWGD